MDSYEHTLLVKPEVFVYQIPPRQSSRGYRGSDWDLANPAFTVRMRIISLDKKCIIKLEDKNTGQPFAEAPVEQFPGPAVEAVTDSSRYFVLRVVDSGRHAFIGIGFNDRADSFDFNVALQDHFKREKQEELAASAPAPKLDLAFKEGQKIHINLGAKKTDKAKPSSTSGGGLGFLPPPPGSGGAPQARPVQQPPSGMVFKQTSTFGDPAPTGGDDSWSGFHSGGQSSDAGQSSQSGWVKF